MRASLTRNLPARTALILLAYCILAFGDASTAVPWCDEAWLADPALTYLRTGHFGTPLLTPFGWGPPQQLTDIANHTYWIMPVHMIMQAAWYKCFGFSLISLRSLSILWGAVAIISIGSIAKLLDFGTNVVTVAMLLTATDYYFLTRAADGRMDIIAAALMLSSLAVYLWWRDQSMNTAAALAGCLAAASFFTHPVGGFFALCGLAVLLIAASHRPFKMQHLLLFSLPFLVGGMAWGAYGRQNPSAFRAQLAGNAAGRWRGVLDPLWSIHEEIRLKYFQAFGLNDFSHPSLQYLRLIPLAAYLIGVSMLFWKRPLRDQPGSRIVLLLVLAIAIGGMGFDGAKRAYYLTYLLPFLTLTLAVFVNSAWKSGSQLRHGAVAMVAAVVLINLAGTVYRIVHNEYAAEYLAAVKFLRQHHKGDDPVMGSGEAAFALGFPDYLSDDVSLGYFNGSKPQLVFSEKTHWGLWLRDLPVRAPQVGAHVAYTLEHDYRMVYDSRMYQIFERRSE